MRPLRLELKGFTSFRDPVEVDFRNLDLFAISGPTGSGKSSLLDAMTYALYGRVERVGDRVSQLISQGQSRMAVTLEYEVGRERYRITRSTAAKGASKILLERSQDDGWIQAGEGADRVRDADRLIAGTIGLTYDGFTRSVLLPQGKFAELLVGDPKKRRDILTELLGLSLFKRMAERAGQIEKEARLTSATKAQLLESEYGDVSLGALKAARASAREAAKRERTLAEAAEAVGGFLERWQGSKRSIDELRACAQDAGAAAEAIRSAADELATLGQALGQTKVALAARAAEVQQAREDHERAGTVLREAQARSGSTQRLAEARGWALALADARASRVDRETSRARAVVAAGPLGDAEAETAQALTTAKASLAGREAAFEAADAALEDARQADHIAALTVALKPGDPCPVCGLPLETLPAPAVPGALAEATRARAAARTALDLARAEVNAAERSGEAARRELRANADEQARLAKELEEAAARVAEHEGRLAAVLGAPLPADPTVAVDERLGRLERLDRAEREAGAAVATADQARLEAEQEVERVAGRIDRVRDRLAGDHRPLFDRAARAFGTRSAPPKLSPPPDAKDPAALEAFAVRLAAGLGTLSDRLTREMEERSSAERDLLAEATTKTEALFEPQPTLEGLARAVDAECRTAAALVATAGQLAEQLEQRLERKRVLAEEVRRLDDRAHLFKALAMELRADRLIAFLQAEALQLLAAAGSDRLATLSDGRYHLRCRSDEFFVVDTWNGDDERSVRTLSGGETFLASLALALALAEQVRSLSVTEKARLDSLFLDEGFGTLDPESLRIVVDAVEQLGGDGRLVGVITHVKELADQFTRIEVTKSPRGSHLALVG